MVRAGENIVVLDTATFVSLILVPIFNGRSGVSVIIDNQNRNH
jgi:hypothetical protein